MPAQMHFTLGGQGETRSSAVKVLSFVKVISRSYLREPQEADFHVPKSATSPGACPGELPEDAGGVVDATGGGVDAAGGGVDAAGGVVDAAGGGVDSGDADEVAGATDDEVSGCVPGGVLTTTHAGTAARSVMKRRIRFRIAPLMSRSFAARNSKQRATAVAFGVVTASSRSDVDVGVMPAGKLTKRR